MAHVDHMEEIQNLVLDVELPKVKNERVRYLTLFANNLLLTRKNYSGINYSIIHALRINFLWSNLIKRNSLTEEKKGGEGMSATDERNKQYLQNIY